MVNATTELQKIFHALKKEKAKKYTAEEIRAYKAHRAEQHRLKLSAEQTEKLRTAIELLVAVSDEIDGRTTGTVCDSCNKVSYDCRGDVESWKKLTQMQQTLLAMLDNDAPPN